MKRAGQDEDVVTVRVPPELPVLSRRAARTLLGILVTLTEVPVPGEPAEEVPNDH